MSAYAVFAILAGFTLDGKFRIGVWIILGAIALRTWIVVLKRGMD